jgi:hypothetical protein
MKARIPEKAGLTCKAGFLKKGYFLNYFMASCLLLPGTATFYVRQKLFIFKRYPIWEELFSFCGLLLVFLRWSNVLRKTETFLFFKRYPQASILYESIFNKNRHKSEQAWDWLKKVAQESFLILKVPGLHFRKFLRKKVAGYPEGDFGKKKARFNKKQGDFGKKRHDLIKSRVLYGTYLSNEIP